MSPLDLLLKKEEKLARQSIIRMTASDFLNTVKIIYMSIMNGISSGVLQPEKVIQLMNDVPVSIKLAKLDGAYEGFLLTLCQAFLAIQSQILKEKVGNGEYARSSLEFLFSILTAYRAFPVGKPLDLKTIEQGSEFILPSDDSIRTAVSQLMRDITSEDKSEILNLLQFEIYHSNKATPNGHITAN